jgi:hypothetical protein
MFAGGWAIDLFLGKVTRSHKDIDVAIFREHQLALQRYLPGWRMYIAEAGKLELWEPGQIIQLPKHTLWAYGPENACAGNVNFEPDLEVLLNERNSVNWVYRRNPVITLPVHAACLATSDGVPYLAPEIVLLYKAKGTRDSDHADFQVVLGSLNPEQKQWLREALELDRLGHEWLEQL